MSPRAGRKGEWEVPFRILSAATRWNRRRPSEGQAGDLFGQIPSATTTSALLALLAIALLWDAVAATALAGWGASIYLVSTGRLLLAGRYRLAQDRNERLWLRGYLVGTTLAGGSWGGLAILLDPRWPAIEQIGKLTLLVGVCAGAISRAGSHLGAYLSLLIPCLVPLVVRLATSGNSRRTLISAAAVLYGADLIGIARPYSRAFAQARNLARAKGQLVEQLSAVNDDLSAEVLLQRRIGRDYPEPIVDLHASRAQALERFDGIKRL